MSLIEGRLSDHYVKVWDCGGELLRSNRGRDANNQVYPIAWAVVDIENKLNWKWFLELITSDLELDGGSGNRGQMGESSNGPQFEVKPDVVYEGNGIDISNMDIIVNSILNLRSANYSDAEIMSALRINESQLKEFGSVNVESNVQSESVSQHPIHEIQEETQIVPVIEEEGNGGTQSEYD
uniref:MULE transposase domain-containing protein n=1 Tax=Lactuca sativa TaxID=4236 RepID=A0A9R1UJ23_LACSA|nr:hypothetical protein LSAT_V11C900455230 [Lactuca sativa]